TLFGLGEANPQCVDVTGQQPGSATLTVATANAQKTISLVVASMMRRPDQARPAAASSPPAAPARRPAPGQRVAGE
ncbi:MAG TPA: hypothetical protein VKN99_18575, partial [Polyangia bacterium]|nr:hypothetical protein [Polyangia bacterium]